MLLGCAWFGRHCDEPPALGKYMRLYHNPRCSKSRQAVALLEQRKIEFEDYRYLDVGVAAEDIDLILSLDHVIRTNEKEFQSSGIDLKSKDKVKSLLMTTPSVLQRPILIAHGTAVIGRPVEEILTLLPDA
jgi:arsenate reductase